jgi:hypothetical protein
VTDCGTAVAGGYFTFGSPVRTDAMVATCGEKSLASGDLASSCEGCGSLVGGCGGWTCSSLHRESAMGRLVLSCCGGAWPCGYGCEIFGGECLSLSVVVLVMTVPNWDSGGGSERELTMPSAPRGTRRAVYDTESPRPKDSGSQHVVERLS